MRQDRGKDHREENPEPVHADVRYVPSEAGGDLRRAKADRFCGLGLQTPAVAEGRGGEVEGRAPVLRGEEA